MKNKTAFTKPLCHFLKSAFLKSVVFAFSLLLCTLTLFGQSSKQLSIKPVIQQTEVWCWAAVAEMTFKHYNLPNLNQNGNFQCGIVAIYFGKQSPCWYDCSKCITTIGVVENIHKLVNEYGLAIRKENRQSPNLNSQLVKNFISFQSVKNEIDNNRPILAGIKKVFGNQSQHVTLIIGYETSTNENYLIVNDPFPFKESNPYFVAGATETQKGQGQYKISYNQFVNALQWNNSIYKIISDANTATTTIEETTINCFQGKAKCRQLAIESNKKYAENLSQKCKDVGCPCEGLIGAPFLDCRNKCNQCLEEFKDAVKTHRETLFSKCEECEELNQSNTNEDFCSSINTVINDVKNNFGNIKSSFNINSSDCNIYNSSIKIPSSSKNEIWFCPDSKYFTAKLYKGNDYEDALEVFQNISDELKICFADSNPVERETSNAKRITLYTSEARITISIYEYGGINKGTFNVTCDIQKSE